MKFDLTLVDLKLNSLSGQVPKRDYFRNPRVLSMVRIVIH